MTDRPRRLLILGATGALGRHVLRQALDAGHEVTVFVRTPSRLAPVDAERVTLHVGDLRSGLPLHVAHGHDALINCAGHVNDGEAFVTLVDQVVTTVERLPATEQPLCWFLAGVALLNIDASGRRGIDLPAVNATYWPHEINFERLKRSQLDWRLLCPGPMVDGPPLGVDRLRSSLDTLPIEVPVATGESDPSALLSAFASVVPQLIVPYAVAAAVMLRSLRRGDATSRHRVGLALPVGMQGRK
jgi:putative NADH-flavin reductase